MKFINLSFLIIFIVGCSIKQDLNYAVIDDFNDENETYFIDETWYKKYNQPYLNELIDLALKTNYDLKQAGLNLEQAYANLGISELDLLPTLSGSAGANTARNIDRSDDWSENYRSGFNVSYELDLFGKIRSSINSQAWSASATYYDLENVRLTLINSVVSGYFEMLYLNESLKWTQENLQNYYKLRDIVKAKYDLGRSEFMDYEQMNSNILNLENRILSLKKQIESNKLFLRKLIGADFKENGGEFYNPILKSILIKEFNQNLPSLENIGFLGVDMNVPFTALSNRPDIRTALSTLNSGFYNYKVSKLNFFPSISLGGGISGNGDSTNDAITYSSANGTLSIALPFLDYGRLSKRLKISKLAFEKNRLNYEKTLSNAANEVLNLYKNYQIELENLANLEKTYESTKKIAEIYNAKYNAGNSEFRDFINAKTSEINAFINVLSQRYNVIVSENKIYKFMIFSNFINL